MNGTNSTDARTPENQQPLAARPTDRFGGRYLGWLALLALGIYLLPFALVRVPAYDHVVGTYYGPLLDWGFSLRDVNADVVVFGDSTAIFDVDPVAAGKALGLKVVNLPNTIGSLPVTREDVLDQYLRHNRAPRLLVFHFSAWGLDYGNTPPVEAPAEFEGQDMLLRHGTLREIAAYFKGNLRDLLEFPLNFYQAVPEPTLVTLYHRAHPFALAAANLGRADYPLHAPALEDACRFPEGYLNRRATAKVDELVARYGTAAGTQTLVYVAPVPACAGAETLASRTYRGGATAPPGVLPANDFGQGYAHVRVTGVAVSTALFVQAVRRALAR